MASENSETNVAGKWQEEGIVSKVKWERVQMRQEMIVEWVVAGGRREDGERGKERGHERVTGMEQAGSSEDSVR